jgi:hypothetical protein
LFIWEVYTSFQEKDQEINRPRYQTLKELVYNDIYCQNIIGIPNIN